MTGTKRGRLKIYLGYAAGVGKTYKMLDDAQQAHHAGQDVVVGYFEPHGRADTIAKTAGLEMVPRRRVEYRGVVFEEMDTEAILARKPEICAVDEFPHTNVPGSARPKRWEDVMALIEAGIDVWTTMNIQHVESLNDQMREITGVTVRETIPDWVLLQADEVVSIDLPPRALLNRLQRGVIYSQEKAEKAMANFFKEPALAALREMALRQTAQQIENRQQAETRPLDSHTQERLLIHVTDAPAAAALIRRGRRVSDFMKAECFAVCVLPFGGLEALPADKREALERHLDFARRLRIETRVLEGDDPAETLVDFARRNGVTQIFLSKPSRDLFSVFGKRDLVTEVVRLASDRQVTVVAERRRS